MAQLSSELSSKTQIGEKSIGQVKFLEKRLIEMTHHIQYLEKKNLTLEKDYDSLKSLKADAEQKFEQGLQEYKRMFQETSQGYTSSK